DDATLGIDAGGDIRRRDLARRLAQLVGILRLGQRVQIDDTEDAVVIVLQRDPVADRAEIITEMQIAGRLDAGKNSVHGASAGRMGVAVSVPAGPGSSRLPRRSRTRAHQLAAELA